MQTLRPLGKRILVKMLTQPTEKDSRIVIPDSAKPKPSRGLVKAIGREVEGVTVGDTVLVSAYGGSRVPDVPEDTLVIYNMEDVIAVVL